MFRLRNTKVWWSAGLQYLLLVVLMAATAASCGGGEAASEENTASERSAEERQVDRQDRRMMREQVPQEDAVLSDEELGLKFLDVENEFKLNRAQSSRLKAIEVRLELKKRRLEKRGLMAESDNPVLEEWNQERRTAVSTVIEAGDIDRYFDYVDNWKK